MKERKTKQVYIHDRISCVRWAGALMEVRTLFEKKNKADRPANSRERWAGALMEVRSLF